MHTEGFIVVPAFSLWLLASPHYCSMQGLHYHTFPFKYSKASL